NGEYEMPSNIEKLLAVADPDLEHFGVKGMKWGKRKAAGYMDKVNKHEAKTKARRSMTYMEKVRAHESKTKADWAKVRDIKAREKAQGKAVAKKYMNSVNKHESKTKARRERKITLTKKRRAKAKAAISKNYNKTVKKVNDPKLK